MSVTTADGRQSANPAGRAVAHTKVFVVGCARSGTTWTRAILAEHPNVVSGHESRGREGLMP